MTFEVPTALLEAVTSPVALILLKVTAVFAAAWITVRVLRDASASLRHLVVALALVAGLAIPVLDLALPGWQVLPRPDLPAPAIVPAPDPNTGQVDIVTRTVDGQPRFDVAVTPDARDRIEPAVSSAAPAADSPTARSKPLQILVGIWLIGVVVLLTRFLLRTVAMMVSAHRARPFDDPDWRRLTDEVVAALNIRHPVQLRLRAAGQMPAVWGVHHPVVLLPADCKTWNAERRRAVITHELAHIARRDLLVLYAGHLTCALHWFNPLSWALQHRLAIEREHACDDVALRQGATPKQYAEVLVTTAAAYRKHRSLAPVMAARSQLEGRIMAILDTDKPRRSASRSAQAAVAALALFALIPLSGLTWAQQKTEPWLDQMTVTSDTARFRQQLGRLGTDLNDVEQLIRGLSAADALTRGACAWALGEFADPRAMDPLITASADPDAIVRQWAVRSLAQYDDPAVIDPLLARTSDVDAETRQWAVRSVSDFDDPRVIDPLVDRVLDDDVEVREWAVRALGDRADDPRARRGLVAGLDDTAADVREWSVRSLGGAADDPEVQRALADRLDDPAANVREWAARKLQGTHDEAIKRDLRDVMRNDPDPEVREWALRTLKNEYATPNRDWRPGDREPLMGSSRAGQQSPDPETRDSLIDMLRDDQPDVREWAVRGLGDLGDARAVDPLVDTLQDPNADVRQWAVRSLGQLGDSRMVPPLIDTLDDTDAEVREWAVRALGASGDARAIAPLQRMLNDENADVRDWARRALEALDRR